MGWEGIEWGGWWWDWAVGDGIRRLGVGLGGGGGIPEVGGGRIPSPPSLNLEASDGAPNNSTTHDISFHVCFCGFDTGMFLSCNRVFRNEASCNPQI